MLSINNYSNIGVICRLQSLTDTFVLTKRASERATVARFTGGHTMLNHCIVMLFLEPLASAILLRLHSLGVLWYHRGRLAYTIG